MQQTVASVPLINMVITIAIVCVVLYGLRVLRGRKVLAREAIEGKKQAATATASQGEMPVRPAALSTAGIPSETVAVIIAAVSAYGFGMADIKAIRPVLQDGWREAGRLECMKHLSLHKAR
jgi:glutaconyl-CoA/methylmalonyl-CoA decarboxylase subunit delta